jgi:hypothetical protein
MSAAATPGTAAPVVVATGGETSQTQTGTEIHQDGQPAAKPAAKKFESKVEETLWRVNNPTQDEVDDAASMDQIIDNAQANAGKSSKEANAPAEKKTSEDGSDPKTEPSQKKKYVVTVKQADGTTKQQEYELTQEQADRFAQKGIMWEKRSAEIIRREKALAAKEQEVLSRDKQGETTLNKLQEQALDALVEMHGEEKARAMMEAWLRPKIQEEMMPEEQRQILQERRAREAAEARLKQYEEKQQKQELDQKVTEVTGRLQKTIIDTLEKGGIPKTEFTAAEIASWMKRGKANGIQYTPDQLANLVREDNMMRVGSLTEPLIAQITAAKKAGNQEQVLKAGEQLVEMFGDQLMAAVGSYYLAKAKSAQPNGGNGPKTILDTPKVRQQAEPEKKGYMTEDEYKQERMRRVAAMERGEHVPDSW